MLINSSQPFVKTLANCTRNENLQQCSPVKNRSTIMLIYFLQIAFSILRAVVPKLLRAVTQSKVAIKSYYAQYFTSKKNATSILVSILFSLLFSKFI